MSVIRQDAWSSDEDLILAEVVLRHIREGSTQLAAFEEVGERLSRTSAACGFRWNSTIRKKYDAAIALAKKQRKKLKQDREEQEDVEFAEEENIHVSVMQENSGNKEEALEAKDESGKTEDQEEEPLTLESVIAFLKKHESNFSRDASMKKENDELRKENKQLQSKVDSLLKEIELLRKEKDIINEDYRALIGIMDRARKMSIIVDESKETLKSRK